MTASGRFTLLIAYVLTCGLLGAYYCSIPPSPDQSIFDYMAMLNHLGALHYSGAFDVTWPGQLLVHDLGVALFGVHPWTARLTDFLYLQLGIVAVAGFAAAAGYRRAAVALLFVYPLIYVTSGSWMTGLRDIVAMHLLIGAAALLVWKPRHRFAAGLLVGYAVATRPTYLLFAGWVVIDDLLRTLRNHGRPTDFAMRTIGLASGMAAIALAFAIAGYATGTLGPWFAQAVRFVVEVYSDHGSRGQLAMRFLVEVARDWHWLALAALIGAVTWGHGALRTRPLSLVAGMTITVLVSYFVQNKGFGYHRSGLIPLMTITACIGAEIGWTAWRAGGLRAAGRWVVLAGACAAILMTLGAMLRFKNNLAPFIVQTATGSLRPDARSDERDRMVSIVRAESRKGDTFYQFGWNYDVAYLSELPSPSRYINGPAMTMIRADDAKYSQWLAQLEDDLVTRRPRFVLIDRNYIAERRDSPMARLMARIVASHYRVRACGASMGLYERDDLTPRAMPGRC